MNQQLSTQDFNIVITEYPKSGGTWLVTLLGDTLKVPKRDLYITEERISDSNNTFYKGILDHHWYKGFTSVNVTPASVVKSHELPQSPLINYEAKFLHLLRDGRDVIVSKYFYEKDFCVRNGLTADFDVNFTDFIVRVAEEWKHYVESWLNEKIPYIKYEDLLLDTKQTLIKALDLFAVPYDEHIIDSVIADNTKENFRAKLQPIYKHNTFVRKGISGDWKNHFTKAQNKIFNKIAHSTLVELGYEKRKFKLFF